MKVYCLIYQNQGFFVESFDVNGFDEEFPCQHQLLVGKNVVLMRDINTVIIVNRYSYKDLIVTTYSFDKKTTKQLFKKFKKHVLKIIQKTKKLNLD